MKVSFVLNYGLDSKTGKWICLENEKPDIILKTLKRFNIKRTPIIISLKLGIVFLVMINNILVKVFIIDFNSGYGPGSQKPSL